MRLRLFGRCQIYHDPVSPVLKAPASIGWTAWFRQIDLVTPRKFTGRELLMKTKGWWTIEPKLAAPVIENYGRIVVGDKGELMVEFKDPAHADALSQELFQKFNDEVFLAP